MILHPADEAMRRWCDLNRFTAYQRCVVAEHASRLERHQAIIAQLAAARADGHRPLNLLANGDSWFDYPLGGTFPGEHTDVVAGLRKLGSPAPVILNLAHYGDTSVQELGLVRQRRMAAVLTDPRNGTFDAILVSAGGNDIVGDPLVIWLKDADEVGHDAARAVEQDRFAAALAVVRAAYLDLIAIRDALLPGALILAHSYDFPLPSGQGVCTLGPWLRPSLQYCGWTDEGAGASIIRSILAQFAGMLDGLADSVPNFVHVRTQGTLAADRWSNELHPDPSGFTQIAAKFLAALTARFPGRV